MGEKLSGNSPKTSGMYSSLELPMQQKHPYLSYHSITMHTLWTQSALLLIQILGGQENSLQATAPKPDPTRSPSINCTGDDESSSETVL